MSLNITVHKLAGTEEHIHFCTCSPDAKRVACALGNGSISILNAITFDSVACATPKREFAGLPATSVRWIPPQSPGEQQLVSSSCAGGVLLWSLDSIDGSLRYSNSVIEDGNEVMAVDVSPSGNFVISAGSDRVIRLYDSALQLLSKLVDGVNPDGTLRPTHINRVFSARFLSDSLAVSAGWESPVQIWDLNSRMSNRQVVGVMGSSDCLEPVSDAHLVLVATPKATETLQLFDSVTGRVMVSNSKTACAHLKSEERVVTCRFCEKTGHVWCITTTPPSVIVLALSSGNVLARARLPAQPLNMSLRGTEIIIGCKNGVLLQVSVLM
ncbi:hypothetical protein ABL78_7795 [Leptomonas seymouri]|uniref:Uncharacterized protein n=1 Tax=Leptomonas seymouri TaxID=5684 RepID=A0A0N1IGS3_LEPSE|nr:hypothetical protein ABL78_7795 [Leptomonas seymouri]|eukprot:KPI83182.1 hypothetical protein ABL78_7795 [Leptomonas seymouri]